MRAAGGTVVTTVLSAALCIVGTPRVAAAQTAPDTGWVRLFDGSDLDGWVVKITGREVGRDPLRTFRVEDGVLKVSYDGYTAFDGAFGHLFHRIPASSYRLRLEYRFTGQQVEGGPDWAIRNSGLMVHSQAPETMTRDQQFPVSIEFQFLGGDAAAERPTGNLCTPGTNVVIAGRLVTRHCTNSSAPTFHGDQWVRAEIEVHGDSLIRHIIDGRVVLEYEKPQLDPNDADAKRLIRGPDLRLGHGWIALQSESHPVEFRNIEMRAIH
ncbi:MAG: DUF1080 domain-containing protein [Gemmatimonadota bacterium]|jgi:hypothetical protein